MVHGHLVAYFVDSVHAIEGQGFTERVWVGGTENVPPDTTGPAIAIYLNSRSFRPGDAVSDDPILFVDLADSNGINTSVSGIGHRIEAWVNGGSQSRDLTDLQELCHHREPETAVPLQPLQLDEPSTVVV